VKIVAFEQSEMFFKVHFRKFQTEQFPAVSTLKTKKALRLQGFY